MVQFIWLIGFKIQPVDGYMAVCYVLKIDVYGRIYFDVRCKLIQQLQ